MAAAGESILPPGAPTANPYLVNKPQLPSAQLIVFSDARRAMGNKQWGLAEQLLQKLLAQNAKLSGAQLNLGIVYEAQGDTKRAAAAYEAAIAANANNLDAYNQLAILRRAAGDFAAAEILYKKALSIWVFHPASHKNIAILYDLYLGKSAEALPHYEAYLTLIGGADKQAISWIADLQRRLGISAKAKTEPKAATPEVDQ
jgi:tetratricopeptide (TPR) repeat protein